MIRLFRVSLPAPVLALLVSEAILAFACYALAFLGVGGGLLDVYYLYEGGSARTLVVVASLLLSIYFNDLYSNLSVRSRLRLVQQFCLVFGIAFWNSTSSDCCWRSQLNSGRATLGLRAGAPPPLSLLTRTLQPLAA